MPRNQFQRMVFAFAYGLENVIGSPCSFRLASKVFDMEKTHPVLLSLSASWRKLYNCRVQVSGYKIIPSYNRFFMIVKSLLLPYGR